ncbi:MurR/RpiR family transcriptional regulator [Pseudomonas gingeri NCPPB 3146 = LMG 5327]|uniref:MurR/RpiR family transcriptional regulator n=2 Tax=Pseudomonas gingeri TaxID=117681 RepID=A0A7Y7Y894_9PSED|nr:MULTISPECIES: MurR/RpiR family transcriptional regulator [Pseudomonas]NVZ29954.1 MurR/RpiR family transcriptional regulator [Pseudomonas gingeri]NVZ65183.1 MurR/RpiR family transcriptional regulator [Pseudomonas gingeri]NVZ74726.1 MurR/RpiR family transcriptional regulator [Pseudomonas gingeri]NWC18397.1 MurR/RpiR family transcriptional regulator [Pseudomonas gingeri]NWE49676.1 MurR/RpiR family transcriptional regulator [Pseudomonas gingeri]
MSTEKNSFLQVLEQQFSSLTPTGKRIASYLLGNPEQLPFESADSIAQQASTTGISVGRFLRSLGYQNIDEVKKSLRGEAPSSWLITDRIAAFRAETNQEDALDRSMSRELEAIQHAYGLARSEAFARIVQRIHEADAVFILGIQSTRGILTAFHSHLEYIRPKVYYVDGLSGIYAETLNSGFANPYAIIADFRAYSSVTQAFCNAAIDNELATALITDLQCPWARDYPLDLLQLKTDVGQFWDSPAPLACLLNLVVSAVAEKYGERLDERLARNRQLQKAFGQFEG